MKAYKTNNKTLTDLLRVYSPKFPDTLEVRRVCLGKRALGEQAHILLDSELAAYALATLDTIKTFTVLGWQTVYTAIKNNAFFHYFTYFITLDKYIYDIKKQRTLRKKDELLILEAKVLKHWKNGAFANNSDLVRDNLIGFSKKLKEADPEYKGSIEKHLYNELIERYHLQN